MSLIFQSHTHNERLQLRPLRRVAIKAGSGWIGQRWQDLAPQLRIRPSLVTFVA